MSKIKITKQIREFIKSDNKLSANARLFYLLLADRADLSEKNKETFSDEHGIFVYYPLSEIQDDIHCSEKTAIKILVELSDAGLIERRHTQRADKIYVLQTVRITELGQEKVQRINCKKYRGQTVKITDNQNPTKQKPKNQENKSSSSSTPPQKISDEQIKNQADYERLTDDDPANIVNDTTNQNPTKRKPKNQKNKSSSTSPQKISDEQIKNQVDYDRLIDDDPANIPLYNMMVDILANDDGIYNKDIGYEHLHSLADTIKGKKDIVHIRAYLRTCLKNIVVDFAVKNQKNEKPKKYKDKYEKDWETLKRVSSDPSYTWLD